MTIISALALGIPVGAIALIAGFELGRLHQRFDARRPTGRESVIDIIIRVLDEDPGEWSQNGDGWLRHASGIGFALERFFGSDRYGVRTVVGGVHDFVKDERAGELTRKARQDWMAWRAIADVSQGCAARAHAD